MPVKWSALEIAEAMDEVEKLLDQAEPFLAEAEAKARKATGISYLPQYMEHRLGWLIDAIERRSRARDTIARVRKDIPQDAIEAERQAGNQLRLGVELKP